MVSVVGALPKGNANGLEDHTRVLAQGLAAGAEHFVVGVMVTDSVVTKGVDLVPTPKMRFVRVELLQADSSLVEQARLLLEGALIERQNGVGQPTFDLDGGES